MRVEIYGGTLSNFGDELMLRRTLAELRGRIEGFVPVVKPHDLMFELRSELGLRQILPGLGRGPLGARAAVAVLDQLAPTRVERLNDLYGVVSPRSVDAAITLSGFAFSDVWGSAAERAAKVFEAHARRGRPVVLLPQALGPFEDPSVRSAFARIVGVSALVLARDDVSFQYARSACPGDARIKRAFDITLDESGAEQPIGSRIRVVPNQRMLDRGPALWRARYVDVMVRLVRALLRAGNRVDVLVHGREEADFRLAREILDRTSASWIPTRSARDARRHLASSLAVIASRYHAAAGALAAAVPVLAIGWAHKYEGLFEDFNLREFSVAEDESVQEIIDRAISMGDPSLNQSIRTQIRRKLPGIREANAAMWDEVAGVLVGQGPYGSTDGSPYSA